MHAAFRDALICLKMDATNGSAVWAVSVGGTSSDVGYGITSVGSNKVAVTGYFGGTATFGDVVLSSKGSDDVFIAMVSVFARFFSRSTKSYV